MLKIVTEKPGKCAVLKLSGVFDLDGVKAIKEAMQEVRRGGFLFIILDFTDVKQVQNSSLKEMLTPLRALTIVQGRAAFCNMNQGIQRIMKTAPFYNCIDVYNTLEETIQQYETLASAK